MHVHVLQHKLYKYSITVNVYCIVNSVSCACLCMLVTNGTIKVLPFDHQSVPSWPENYPPEDCPQQTHPRVKVKVMIEGEGNLSGGQLSMGQFSVCTQFHIDKISK